MKKISTLALAGLVGVSTVASASVSRWNGFGAANAYIADVQDIWTLPGVVASNKNAMYLELGTATGPNVSGGVDSNPVNAWGGVHTEVGPGVLGVWVNRGQSSNVDGLFNSLGAFTAVGTLSVGTLNSALGTSLAGTLSGDFLDDNAPAAGRVDLLYGFSLSETVDLGILISRANRNGKVENVGNVAGTVDSYDANALSFGIGAELKEVAIFKLLELGLVIDTEGSLLSAKTTANEDKLENSVSLTSLRVGGDIAGDEGKFGRLELGFALGSANAKNSLASVTPATGDKEKKTNGMKWNLGYAAGKSGEKGLGLVGLMLSGDGSSSETDGANSKSDRSEMALQLSTAGEAKIKEWLTARAGLSQNLYQSSSSTGIGASNQVKTNRSNNGAATVTTGLSLTFGDWVIDGVLNQDVLYTGTFFISGVAESLFSQVSATMSF